MHVNKFLYKHFHSWHHRLYVPYAFGSLYNHPVEGLVLDSLGALIAEWATGMTTRQAMLLFIFSTLKTELTNRFDSHGQATRELFAYIEAFYNRRRRHSTLGMVSPADYEQTQTMETSIKIKQPTT